MDQQISLDDLNALVKCIILAPDSRQTFVDAVHRIVESVFAYERKTFSGEIRTPRWTATSYPNRAREPR